ncbi:MAG: hypothetical protein ABUT20_37025 [Bacteroidota bacterium]
MEVTVVADEDQALPGFLKNTFNYGCQEKCTANYIGNAGLVNGGGAVICGCPENKIVLSSLKYTCMMIVLLLLAVLICFWLFYKATDWFENI